MAAEQRPGDGINPAEERRARARERSDDRHGHSLERFARVVERAVAHALAQSDVHPINNCSVVSVLPERGNFTIHLACSDYMSEASLRELQNHLESLKTACRSEIAASSHRKNIPHLRFLVSMSDSNFKV
jgi:hypothetical protein